MSACGVIADISLANQLVACVISSNMFQFCMDDSDQRQRQVFFEIHSNLPRESAGSDASTLKALSYVKDRLSGSPVIADMACGPGSSVIPLAIALPHANLFAVDLHSPFIEETKRRISEQDLSGRVSAQVENMLSPSIKEGSLDMIWCEGAIYNCGVQNGLHTWRQYLKPDGIVVFNEPVWLVPSEERPPEVKEFWAAYAAMTDADGIASMIKAAGYEILGEFNLPEDDWWATYYAPLEAKLDALETKYANDQIAALPIEHTRKEIEIRRKFPQLYNYRFYATRML